MTVDVDKLLCDSVAKLEAFTRQRRELDLHRYLLIDIMMRKIEMATLEGRNTVAQELGNPQNDGGEPQRPCSFNAGRDPQGGRAEHSQVLMAEMASERDSMQVSDARALGENAPSVTRSEAADTFHGALGVTDRDSLQGDDIVLDGDSMAANSSTDSASLTADEGIHSDLDDVVNAFGDSLADGGPEPGANTSSNDVPGNIDLVSQNSAEALESLQYKDMTTFKVKQECSTPRNRQECEGHVRQCLIDDSRAEQSPAFRAPEPAASGTDTWQMTAGKPPKIEDMSHFDSGGSPSLETLPTSSRESREGAHLREVSEESTPRCHSNSDGDRPRTSQVGANGSPRNLPESVDSASENSSATLERSGHDETCPLEHTSEGTLPDDGDHESENAQEAAQTATALPQRSVCRFIDLLPRLKRPRSEQDLAAMNAGKRPRCSSESALSSKGSSNSERDLSASGPSASSESIGINFEVVEEAEPQLAQGGDADVSSDASKAEDAPASDLFDLTVLKNVIVNVSELPIPSNLLELPDQEPK
ncbi:uncharacterized protein LOC119390612 isoform X2 [Rhipicephalus sanguineus]|uniref:uncharacterized protein LOC119390612 isoform X2 n=1 Tax=Rhipicephalus sanguineus TaxID=34632 RepID=UPI001894002F|nr:uncharacterized protein LOC119390612 isoform X2 [Rhipicephalus sanguineus]